MDFGVSEVNAALASRNLKWKIKYELNLEGPESYRIEPYGYGGGHVTGGDLRGLMYGLLEAANQIRSTGRLSLTHATPEIAVRGVRMFVDNGDLATYSEDFWRGYFQTLARSRLNRFTLVLLSANPYALLLDVNGFPGVPGSAAQRDRNLHMVRVISQTAAEYAVDFTLAFWRVDESGRYAHDALLKLLAECPLIRAIELSPRSADVSAYRENVFKAFHEAGRRVALEPRGILLDPAMLRAAEQAGVALRISSESWPPGFDIDLPPGPGHDLFYWMWGRTAYDPKTKPSRSIPPDEYRNAALLVTGLRNALLADPDATLWPEIHPDSIGGQFTSSDFVASIAEAIRDLTADIASAKQTPLEVADALSAASAVLEKSAVPDFQLLAELARYHSHRLRAAYYIALFDQQKNPAALDRAMQESKDAEEAWKSGESSLEDLRVLDNAIEQRRKQAGSESTKELPEFPKDPARPQITHLPVRILAADQPVTLTLQINPARDVRSVRLHYRSIDARTWKTIEKATEKGTSLFTFTIPAPDLVPDSQFVYYFEILNRENRGWFEPDPAAAIPYHLVRVQPK